MCIHVYAHVYIWVGGHRKKKTERKYAKIRMSQLFFVLILHLSIFSKFTIMTLIAFTIKKNKQ